MHLFSFVVFRGFELDVYVSEVVSTVRVVFLRVDMFLCVLGFISIVGDGFGLFDFEFYSLNSISAFQI